MNIGARLTRAVAGGIAAFLFAGILFVPIASAQTFKDVPTSRWSYEFVEQLVSDGVVTPADNFRPADALNRAELAKLVIEATTGPLSNEDLPATPTFDDVAKDSWYFPYVETAVKLGVVEGYRDASGNLTGLFGPGDSVNRAAGTKMVVNAFGVPTTPCTDLPFSDVKASDWYYSFVSNAYWNSVINGYTDAAGNLTGKFGPADVITREQVAKVIVKAADPVAKDCTEVADCTEDTDCTDGKICEDGTCVEKVFACETDEDCGFGGVCEEGVCEALLPPGLGDLEVTINEEMFPADGDIPRNATRIVYLPLTLTAYDEDILLTQLIVTREGLGNNDDFDEVWAEDVDTNMLSKSTTTVGNDDTAKIKFNSLPIYAGESLDLFVVASMDEDGGAIGNTNRLSVLASSDVLSTAATVVGDFKLAGPLYRKSNYGVAELEFTKQGVVRTVEVGDEATTLGEFQLRNTGGTSDKDVFVRRIILKNTGTSDPENIANVYLTIGSTRVTEIIEVSDTDFFNFEFLDEGVALNTNGVVASNGYTIQDGDSRNFKVIGSIIGADGNGNTIEFKLDEGDRDVVAEEKTTGFGVKVIDALGTDANDILLNVVNIDAGDLNFARSTESPDSSNVAPGTDDKVLLVAKVTTAAEIRIKDFMLHFDMVLGQDPAAPANDLESNKNTPLSTVIDNVRLIQVTSNGVAYASTSLLADDLSVGENVAEENVTDATLCALIDATPGEACATSERLTYNLPMNEDFTVPSSYAVAAAAGYTASTSDGVYNLTPGSIVWLVALDFQDEPAGRSFMNTTVKAYFDNADVIDAEYNVSGDNVPAANVKGNAEGSVFTITPSSLDCIRTDGLGNGEKIVAGDSDIMFAEFTCNNNDSGVVTISDMNLNFGEAGTDVLKQNLTNIELFAREDDGTWSKLGSTEDPENGNPMTVSGIEKEVEASSELKFRVMGAVSTAARTNLPVLENMRVTLEGITAYDQDGDLLPVANITSAGIAITAVTPLVGSQYNLIASGLLTQNVSGDTPDAGVLVGNTYDVEAGLFKVSAVDDDIFVDRAVFGNITAGGLENDPVTNGRIATYKLYAPIKGTTASTLVASSEVKVDSAFNTNGLITFDPSSSMRPYATKGSNIELRVTVDVNSVNSVNETGKYLQLAWVAVESISESSGDDVLQVQVDNDNLLAGALTGNICWDIDGDGAFVGADEVNIAVTGLADGNDIIAVDGSVSRLPAAGAFVVGSAGGACAGTVTNVSGKQSADLFVIRNTKPTVTIQSIGTSSLSHATGLKMYAFNIAADDNDNVHMKRFSLEFTVDEVTLSNFTLYDSDNTTLAVPALFEFDVNGDGVYGDAPNAHSDGDGVADGYNGTSVAVRVTLTESEEITRGTSKTFQIEADVANEWTGVVPTMVATATDNGSTSFRMLNDLLEDVDGDAAGTQNTEAFANMDDVADLNNGFVWSDESAQGHTDTSADFTNGFGLQLPTATLFREKN